MNAGARAFSPTLVILLYHNFFDQLNLEGWQRAANDYMTTREAFDRDIDWICSHPHLQTISPQKFFALPPGPQETLYVYFTFDDGYASTLGAFQVLQENGLEGGLFINSALVDKDELAWPEKLLCFFATHGDDVRSLRLEEQTYLFHRGKEFCQRLETFGRLRAHLKRVPTSVKEDFLGNLYKTFDFSLKQVKDYPFYQAVRLLVSDEIRAISQAGFQVGGHSLTHPILSQADDDRAWSEIYLDKKNVERLTGKSPEIFAIPSGIPSDYGERELNTCREAGYRHVLTWSQKANHLDQNPFVLHRFDVGNLTLPNLESRLTNILQAACL